MGKKTQSWDSWILFNCSKLLPTVRVCEEHLAKNHIHSTFIDIPKYP